MTVLRFTPATRTQIALAAFLTVGFSACSGGGSGGGGNSSFSLVETNVFTSQAWAINRAMTFQFTEPVDINTVNLNSISVTQFGGAPAAGTFSLLDPYTVVFQPTCPTQDNFLDAGLQPGGLSYQIDLVSSTSGGLTVRSMSGNVLTTGLTTNIVTPDSADLADLFDDTQIGPPAPLIWDGTGTPPQSGVSYLEEGGNPDARFILKRRSDSSASALGAEVALDGYTAPLNLYSDASSALAVVVELDQPVDPSVANVNPQTVQMQYCPALDGNCLPGEWIDLAHAVVLESNCVNGGSVLRVTPVGILPVGRLVRVSLASSFRDLVGNGNLLDLPVVSFQIDDGIDPDTMLPVVLQDEFLEPFTVAGTSPNSTEDLNAVLDAPQANWGQDGTLAASFEFGGTGGNGGHFNYLVRQLPGNGVTVLNTIFSTINNEEGTLSQTVVDGQVDVQNFTVAQGAVLEIRGPKACVIRATGNVTINGKIVLKGVDNVGLTTLNSGNLSETGAAGTAGGGRGGTGNVLTTQSSPAGGAGNGAFDLLSGGGGGGETGFSGTGNVNDRRGAGGGGGTFGPPMILFTPTPVVPLGGGPAVFNVNGCPNQSILGLDAEDGNPGALGAGSAILGPGQRPRGGVKGFGPFLDNNPDNNFTGLMRLTNGTVVRGELDRTWAGAGGGGGGNSDPSISFPTPGWTFASDEKGAGGGGGGGSLTILCLGNVVFGTNGRIDAGGGSGGGGENTANFNRVGGGSGGGSGGHVVIQVGQTINFVDVRTNQSLERDRGGIWTRGGQGGDGRDGMGGTGDNGQESTATADRLPLDHYNLVQGGLATPAPCAVAAAGNVALGLNATNGMPEGVAGCGGDGGPGIIQLHVPLPANILTPTGSGESLSTCLRPNPLGSTITVGTTAATNTSNVNTPAMWNQMLPGFGRLSTAQSKWIPLGSTSVAPTSTTPETTQFQFGGVDALGQVLKSGSGSGATQLELPSVLNGSGSQAIVTAPGTPYITADKRTVVFDGTTLTDEIYLSNPALLRFFDVRIVVGATTQHFEAVSSTYDETSGLLRITIGTSGLPLNLIPTDGSAMVSLRPRFFRVRTANTPDLLPDPASIRFEFQATLANASNQPNEAATTPWTTDITTLNSSVSNPEFRFIRFRVTFDLGLGELTTSTPVPSVEFLRIPFRF